MHSVETQSAQRFCSGENIGDHEQQQITPNHISREYEDYTGSQNKIDKGNDISYFSLSYLPFLYFN